MDDGKVSTQTLILDFENHIKVTSFLHSMISGNLLFREDAIIEFRDYRDQQLIHLTNFEQIIALLHDCKTFTPVKTRNFKPTSEDNQKRNMLEFLKNPTLEEQKIEQIRAFNDFLECKDLNDPLPSYAILQMQSLRTDIKTSLSLGIQSALKKATEQLNGAFSTVHGMPIHLQLKKVAELLEKDKISLSAIL